jgi:hypothetical protein
MPDRSVAQYRLLILGGIIRLTDYSTFPTPPG